MNIEQLNAFKKREELIKLIQDDNQRKIELEKLENEKTECYKDCYVKTSQRIKNSEQLLEKLSIGQDKLQNSVSELALIVKNKGTVYDKFIEESNNQKQRFKGMTQLVGILKWLFAAGLGGFVVQLIQNWNF